MIKISKIYSIIENLLDSLEKDIAQIDCESEIDECSMAQIKDKISVKKNVVHILSKIVTVIGALERINDGTFDEEVSEDDMSIIKNFYENFHDTN